MLRCGESSLAGGGESRRHAPPDSRRRYFHHNMKAQNSGVLSTSRELRLPRCLFSAVCRHFPVPSADKEAIDIRERRACATARMKMLFLRGDYEARGAAIADDEKTTVPRRYTAAYWQERQRRR